MATFTCSGCQKTMPPTRDGIEIAVGWAVIRIETHGNANVTIGYLYLCPGCTFMTLPKQTELQG